MERLFLIFAALNCCLVGQGVELHAPAGRLVIDGRSGFVKGLCVHGSQAPLLSDGTKGLWRVRFQDGSCLCAAQAVLSGVERKPAGCVLRVLRLG